MPNYISRGNGDWFPLLASEVTTLTPTFKYGIQVSGPTAANITTIKTQTETDARRSKKD